VQWQRSTDGGASFVNAAGATSTTYTFTAALGDDGNQYRAVFSNGIGSPATTTAATLSVGTAPSFTSADHTTFVVGAGRVIRGHDDRGAQCDAESDGRAVPGLADAD